jgi:hypothetical protein
MCHFVDGLVKDMKIDLSRLDHEIDELSTSSNFSLDLRNKSDNLIANLEQFKEKYLQPASSSTRR